MNFQQLLAVIPLFEGIESCRDSRSFVCPEGCHALVVVRSGHITIASPSREPVVCTQGFAIHPNDGRCELLIPKTKEAEYAIIVYRMVPGDSPWTLRGRLFTVSEIKIRYMIDELIRTAADIDTPEDGDKAAQQFRMRMILERILFIFLFESKMRQEDKSSIESIDDTISYMNEHYMLKLTLPMLARRAGMSEGHYTVLFKKQTGFTLTAYLRRVRIEKAMEMLRQTKLPAKEIAQMVGFADYFHFSRVFKQETGCSPSDFQKAGHQI